ncbi:methyltransferase domain-containing protein [Streptomyces sp. NPDC048685]|uniref:methyltransferase domain-containing protein n=1 Tax=Streptomyces sp. NPDC048685 TaxID=3365584 RepID=UPI003715D0EB
MDGYRADKVIHELAEPKRALAEARRVLRPGGRIVLLGQDRYTIIVDSADPALTPSDALRGVDGKSGPLFRRRP